MKNLNLSQDRFINLSGKDETKEFCGSLVFFNRSWIEFPFYLIYKKLDRRSIFANKCFLHYIIKYMKKLRDPLFPLLFLASLSTSYAIAQNDKDSVTISGQITDYNQQPIDSCSVFWQNCKFQSIAEAITDKDGFYSIRIPKGKYQSMAAIRMNTYPNSSSLNVTPNEQRLEFWGWDFIAEKDTVYDYQYHRMEVYGIRVFQIPGAAQTYQIYFRPMSLTRIQDWIRNGQPGEGNWAPHSDSLQAIVRINGDETPILMQQEIKEYFAPGKWSNAYLLTVEIPQKKSTNPYDLFKIELTDLENGDRGEGVYYMEKESYVR